MGMVLGCLLKLCELALALDFFEPGVGVVFEVLDLVELFLDFLAATGSLIRLAAFGVGDIVQYHLPLAKAQVWPSLALI